MPRAKKVTKPQTTEQTPSQPETTQPKSTNILATGLEDYGRWKSMYQNYQRDPNEKPFRRGRIWC